VRLAFRESCPPCVVLHESRSVMRKLRSATMMISVTVYTATSLAGIHRHLPMRPNVCQAWPNFALHSHRFTPNDA